MVRGGGGLLVGQGMVVNNTLQLKLFRRKGIHYTYIQLYTATSREEFFQYMFILYYFFKAMRWGRGGGGRSVYSRHLYILGCGGGDASEQNNVRMWVTKTAF